MLGYVDHHLIFIIYLGHPNHHGSNSRWTGGKLTPLSKPDQVQRPEQRLCHPPWSVWTTNQAGGSRPRGKVPHFGANQAGPPRAAHPQDEVLQDGVETCKAPSCFSWWSPGSADQQLCNGRTDSDHPGQPRRQGVEVVQRPPDLPLGGHCPSHPQWAQRKSGDSPKQTIASKTFDQF